MFRSKLIPATMAAVVALGTAGAAFASAGEKEDAKEISAVLNAKTSISQAIDAAEKKTGGRAMKVEVEHEKGAYLYEIKTVSNDKVTEVFVDLATGAVTRTDDEGLVGKVFGTEDRAEFAKIVGSSVTLASAIATAEKEVGGKAIEAAFEDEDGKMLFEVEVAKEKAVHKVLIDSASGKVVKVSASEEGERDKD